MRRSFALGFATCLCVMAHTTDARTLDKVEAVQDVVDTLKSRLPIPDRVVVTIVPHNPLLVSVVRAKDAAATFELSIEDGFLGGLSDEELDSVVAHELGHVWISTHHPFLQTEAGANEIALRLVSRESLDRMYEKTWQRKGAKGDLEYLPGDTR